MDVNNALASEANHPAAADNRELQCLQLHSEALESAGWYLLDDTAAGFDPRAIDIGRGSLGLLRILSGWTDPRGQVVCAEIDKRSLAGARECQAAQLGSHAVPHRRTGRRQREQMDENKLLGASVLPHDLSP